ncbi:FcRgamma subunit S homeolog precursor [Xenopus laevis]|uniref:FcRgamma subunit n=1 Tax=Xenopus laevis TaxID=8355 RepID=Q8AXA6_XENLA|nr:FcRgamma subunit S homeolog precursor [Xenopus laevis]AAI69479.1 FcRgamma subunit [Xenopus laevis]AAI69505.1 FcRgamma subunit [Xenopus laevis]AAO14673.1 FcRgamma subunit [Xenopus laevis]
MWIPTVVVILLSVRGAAALKEPEICYILDAILFLYGIVLTALYCHLKIQTKKAQKSKPAGAIYEHLNYPEKQIYEKIGEEAQKKGEEGEYTGLESVDKGTYETIKGESKKN